MMARDICGIRLGRIDAVHIDAGGGAWASIALRAGGGLRLAPLAGATTRHRCVWLHAHADAVRLAPGATETVLLDGDDAARLRQHYARELHVDATSL